MGIRCNFLLFLFAEKHFSTLNTFFTTARWWAVRSASSSQSAARTQLCQHWGVDMEMFPMWSKHFKPQGWLTNTSHSSVARICRTKHHFFFLFFFFLFLEREILPLVLMAVSILAASLSGSKSGAGTTVGNKGSWPWEVKARSKLTVLLLTS